jgi:hypothetical protein
MSIVPNPEDIADAKIVFGSIRMLGRGMALFMVDIIGLSAYYSLCSCFKLNESYSAAEGSMSGVFAPEQ